MIVVLGLLAGALAVVFLRVGAPDLLASPTLERENYRGHRLPTAAGILIVIAVLVVEAGRAVLGGLGLGDEAGLTVDRSLVLFAVFAFGLLGFVDDVLGDGSAPRLLGPRRRARARAHHDRLPEAVRRRGGRGRAGRDARVRERSSPPRRRGAHRARPPTSGNLLDRAPGRTLKCGLVAYVPLALVLGAGAAGVAIAPAMGAAFALLPDDLAERVMLGDTGANIVGRRAGPRRGARPG